MKPPSRSPPCSRPPQLEGIKLSSHSTLLRQYQTKKPAAKSMIRQQAVPARGDRHSECVQGGKGTLVVADQCLVNV